MDCSIHKTNSHVLYITFPSHPYLVHQHVYLYFQSNNNGDHLPASLLATYFKLSPSLPWTTVIASMGNPTFTCNSLISTPHTAACVFLKVIRSCHSLLINFTKTTMNTDRVQSKTRNGSKYTIYWNFSDYFKVICNTNKVLI